jgi:hypothetical protein
MVYPGMIGELRLELPACLHETITINVDHVAILPCGARVALPAGTILESQTEASVDRSADTT